MASVSMASPILHALMLILCFCPLFKARLIISCPHLCTCRGESIVAIDCKLTRDGEWMQTCSELNKFTTYFAFGSDLSLRHLRSFVPSLGCLPPLNSLRLIQMPQREISSEIFQGVQISSILDLSFNNITRLSAGCFGSLGSIHALNLSNNLIHSVSNVTFTGLLNLKSLDLSYNRLILINVTSFSLLTNLEYLNLAHNKLVAFSSWHLPRSLTLKLLTLQGNNLKHIDLDLTNGSDSRINTLSKLDISDNPLDCSCTMDHLLKSLRQHIMTLDNAKTTICKSPKQFQELSVFSLNETAMTCSSPQSIIRYPSHDKSVLFKEDIRLECKSDGDPAPSVVWITPWGEKFSHSSYLNNPYSDSIAQNAVSFKQYESKNVDALTTIFVNDNNDLVIYQFRGSIAGIFTCVAFNVAGNKSEDIHLSIESMMKPVYMYSLFIGGYTASGFLIFGFIVGFIKMTVMKLKHNNCFTVPIFSKAPSIKPALETSSTFHDSIGKDDTNTSVISSPISTSIEVEYYDDFYKDSSNSPLERRPLHIRESLEEARERLRYGMGRKVESMKRNVQSIKQSSSAYVQNIMESGSSAANRVKASMVQRVETVKSHVQSFKELCGTGEMGMHTISMISVETDIDTNQQTNIVRQITYV